MWRWNADIFVQLPATAPGRSLKNLPGFLLKKERINSLSQGHVLHQLFFLEHERTQSGDNY